MLWLFPLLAGTYQGAVGDDIGYYLSLLHVIEDLQGTLKLLPLLAGTYQGVVSDDIGDCVLLLH